MMYFLVFIVFLIVQRSLNKRFNDVHLFLLPAQAIRQNSRTHCQNQYTCSYPQPHQTAPFFSHQLRTRVFPNSASTRDTRRAPCGVLSLADRPIFFAPKTSEFRVWLTAHSCTIVLQGNKSSQLPHLVRHVSKISQAICVAFPDVCHG